MGLLFSYMLNLRGGEFSSYTESKRTWVQLHADPKSGLAGTRHGPT